MPRSPSVTTSSGWLRLCLCCFSRKQKCNLPRSISFCPCSDVCFLLSLEPASCQDGKYNTTSKTTRSSYLKFIWEFPLHKKTQRTDYISIAWQVLFKNILFRLCQHASAYLLEYTVNYKRTHILIYYLLYILHALLRITNVRISMNFLGKTFHVHSWLWPRWTLSIKGIFIRHHRSL